MLCWRIGHRGGGVCWLVLAQCWGTHHQQAHYAVVECTWLWMWQWRAWVKCLIGLTATLVFYIQYVKHNTNSIVVLFFFFEVIMWKITAEPLKCEIKSSVYVAHCRCKENAMSRSKKLWVEPRSLHSFIAHPTRQTSAPQFISSWQCHIDKASENWLICIQSDNTLCISKKQEHLISHKTHRNAWLFVGRVLVPLKSLM